MNLHKPWLLTGVVMWFALAASSPHAATVPSAVEDETNISGMWLDAERAAQGLMLEQIDAPWTNAEGGPRVAVSWYTWAPAGDPNPGARWLFGVGRRNGAEIVVDPVMIARSGAFPTQSPAAPDQLEAWGKLTITFEGNWTATGAKLEFDGPDAWGAGERTLKQVTATGYGTYYGMILDPPLPNVFASAGSYSSPLHVGQGWVLNQYSRNDPGIEQWPYLRVESALIWYTYDLRGQPTWMFGIDGDLRDEAKFTMSLAASGGTFEGGAPQFVEWGDVVLQSYGPPPFLLMGSCVADRIILTPRLAGYPSLTLGLFQTAPAFPWNVGAGFCWS